MTIVTDEEMAGDARIEGHRIAVYHIVDYADAGFNAEEIADEFGIAVEEVDEALDYADSHSISED